MPPDQPTTDLTKESEDTPGYLLRSKANKAKDGGNENVPPADTSHVASAEHLVGPGSRAEASLREASGSHGDGSRVDHEEPLKDSVPPRDAILSVLKDARLVHENAEELPEEVADLFLDCEENDSPSELSGDTSSSPSDTTDHSPSDTTDHTSE